MEYSCSSGTSILATSLRFRISQPVNAADVGLLETTKDINRGGLFKLISTYNNGNVYGAAMLILLPLFDAIETRKWRKLFLRIALVLTLSRSVWIGLVMLQLVYLLRDIKRDFQDFPYVRIGRSTKSLLLLIPIAIGVGVGMVIMSTGLGVIPGHILWWPGSGTGGLHEHDFLSLCSRRRFS